MIRSAMRVVTCPEKRNEATSILRSLVSRVRGLAGCSACRAYSDVLDEHALLLESVWESEEELNRHLRSEEFHKVLLVLEMAAEQPEIRFETISLVTGIETIVRARRGRGEY